MKAERPQLRLERNVRQKMSGYGMLCALEDSSARLCFYDPQYRGVLDKLAFGNEGARQKARASLPQMTDATIAAWMEQIARVLKPSGHVAFWIDKFSVASGHHLRYFVHAPELQIVELFSWTTGRFGMGRRARCCTEYLIVAQKAPTRAKGVWTDNSIRDSWTEQSDRSRHPHAKPYQLTERLIRAVTKRGELVVDPCAGSYIVLEACRASGREFIGCDIGG